jgi:hypothetical protein
MIKVFYPFNPHISRAMHRIRNALIKYAPPDVEFVDKPEGAVHILDFIGQHPTIEDRVLHPTGLMRTVPSLPVSQKYVIIYHCLPPPDFLKYVSEYRRLLEGSMLVFGTYDKSHIYPPDAKINYYRTAWGYEPEVFYPRGSEKKYLALTTGYIIPDERIDWIAYACKLHGKPMVHIGGRNVVDELRATYGGLNITHYEKISDDNLANLYSSSWFTNAMRELLGFELPAVEGYACGSQPVLLDLPCYRYWFSDFGVFVKSRDGVVDVLSKPVNVTPKAEILERFKWKNIAPKIWERILDACT